MSRLSLRALCSIGLALTLLGSSACSDDQCVSDEDCESGQVCGDNGTCGARVLDLGDNFCLNDGECGDGQICNARLCVEGCRTSADCQAGVETCDRSELICVAIPDECEVSADCPDDFICDRDVEDGPLKCVPECSEDADCESGLTCEAGACVGCVSNDECGEGEICRIGRCSPREFQCSRVGQACDPALPVVDGFACAQYPGDDTTFCYEACREETACVASRIVDEEGNFIDENGFIKADYATCPAGSVCRESMNGVEACRRSQCQNPVAGQAACEAVAAADPGEYPLGANCALDIEQNVITVSRSDDFRTLVSSSESYICEPAGNLQRGQTGCFVIPAPPDNPLQPTPPRERCEVGLMCVSDFGGEFVGDGRCEKPCTNDAQCDVEGGESCIGADTASEFNGVGICGVRCEPYVVDNDACPTGTKCIAVTSNDGLCSELRGGGAGTNGVYEACTGDEECASGTRCENFFGSSRCVPECDPTLRNQQQANATCGSPDDNDGNFKVQHLVPDAPAVDIYIDDRKVLDDLAYGEIAEDDGKWLKIKQGNHTIDVVEGSRSNNRIKLLSTTISLDPTIAEIISVVPSGSDGVQFGVVESQRLAQDKPATQAAVRVAHYVAGVGTVDIVAVGDGDVASLPVASALGEGVSFGETTDFANVPTGVYDVYVFQAGGQRDEVSALTVIEDLDVTAAFQATVFAHGRPSTVPAVTVAQFQTFTPPVLNHGYCYDLDQNTTGATRPSSGVCFERCDGYEEFGNTNSCTNSGIDTCGIFGENVAVCQPTAAQVDSPYLLNCDPASATSCPNGLACLGDPFDDGRPDFGVCIWQPQGAQCGTGFQGIQGFLGCEQSAGCIGEAMPPLGQPAQPGTCTALDKNTVYPATVFWGDQCPIGRMQDVDGNCVYAQPGQECGEGTANTIACEEGSFCDQGGDGVGVCRSYCTQDGYPANPSFEGCSDDEVCIRNPDIEGLGECRLACSPDADGVFKDSGCPLGQQTCYTLDGNSYCRASGDIPVNEVCGEYQEFPGLRASEVTTCEAGSLCARNITTPDSTFEVTIDSFLTIGSNEEGRCRQLCRPFLANEASDCGEGYACTPIMPVQEINTFSGICTPKVSQIGIGNNPEACPADEVGRMCGDASFCSLQNAEGNSDSLVCEATAECFELCNPATNLGCSPGKSCDQLGSIDAPSYFIGAFGICRDL